MEKNLEEMIEELNDYCERSLSITHYSNWAISSYKDGTLFNLGAEIRGFTVLEVVVKAYYLMKKDKENKDG